MLWSMILPELLLVGDPDRERWVTTGASFVAVDSLVHNHLNRTGILRRLDSSRLSSGLSELLWWRPPDPLLSVPTSDSGIAVSLG